MDTPKSLRERAEHWRRLAAHHTTGTADALLRRAFETVGVQFEIARGFEQGIGGTPTKRAG